MEVGNHIILPYFSMKTYCGYSIEAPHRGASKRYHNMFCGEIRKTSTIFGKKHLIWSYVKFAHLFFFRNKSSTVSALLKQQTASTSPKQNGENVQNGILSPIDIDDSDEDISKAVVATIDAVVSNKDDSNSQAEYEEPRKEIDPEKIPKLPPNLSAELEKTVESLKNVSSFFIIGIKHGFSCINFGQVPWEVLKTAAKGCGFQHLPRDLANVNALKNHI